MPSNNNASGLFTNASDGWWVTLWIIVGVIAIGVVAMIVGLIKSRRDRSQTEGLAQQVTARAEDESMRDALRTVFVEAGIPESGLPIEDDPVDDEPIAEVDPVDPYLAEATAVVHQLDPRVRVWSPAACDYVNAAELDGTDSHEVDLDDDTRPMLRGELRRDGILPPLEAVRSETGTYRITEINRQERRDGRMPEKLLYVGGPSQPADDEPAVLFDQVSSIYGVPAERHDLSFTGAWAMVPAPTAPAAPAPSKPAQVAVASRPSRTKGGRKGGRK